MEKRNEKYIRNRVTFEGDFNREPESFDRLFCILFVQKYLKIGENDTFPKCVIHFISIFLAVIN